MKMDLPLAKTSPTETMVLLLLASCFVSHEEEIFPHFPNASPDSLYHCLELGMSCLIATGESGRPRRGILDSSKRQ